MDRKPAKKEDNLTLLLARMGGVCGIIAGWFVGGVAAAGNGARQFVRAWRFRGRLSGTYAAATGSPIWSSTRGPHNEPHHEPFRQSPIEALPSKHTIRGMPLVREDIVKLCRFLAQLRVDLSLLAHVRGRGVKELLRRGRVGA